MKLLKHAAVIFMALGLCLGLPCAVYLPARAGGADAVSSASLEIPDRPSGAFVVLLNRERHPLTAGEWSDFFLEKPVGVIMEDISCLTAEGDAAGLELARRYQARLAEHQMLLREVNGTLLVSKAEQGIFDVIVLSKEAAEAYGYSAAMARHDALALTVEGGG